MFDFSGKTVLLTGGTKGIGQETAASFYRCGANVIITGSEREETARLAAENAADSRLHYYYLDFTEAASVEDFFSAMDAFEIDVCVNNAGINRIEHVYELSMEDWDTVMAVNLRGPALITRYAAERMKNAGYGRIVNIASIFGVITREKRAIYSSTKAGLLGFTRTSAVDLAPYNILVNAVSPGFIETELTRSILKPEEMEELRRSVPLGRLGQPEDIARVILFLASDLNTYITGQNIIADGGYVNI